MYHVTSHNVYAKPLFPLGIEYYEAREWTIHICLREPLLKTKFFRMESTIGNGILHASQAVSSGIMDKSRVSREQRRPSAVELTNFFTLGTELKVSR